MALPSHHLLGVGRLLLLLLALLLEHRIFQENRAASSGCPTLAAAREVPLHKGLARAAQATGVCHGQLMMTAHLPIHHITRQRMQAASASALRHPLFWPPFLAAAEVLVVIVSRQVQQKYKACHLLAQAATVLTLRLQ